MEKIIQGYRAYSFGICQPFNLGIEAVTFKPSECSLDTVRTLKDVHLHPILQPNALEIFALVCKQDQYDIFERECIASLCSKEARNQLGHPETQEEWARIMDKKKELVNNFKVWHKI